MAEKFVRHQDSEAFVVKIKRDDSEISLEKILLTSHLDSANKKKLSEVDLLADIPLLARGTIYPFRYDRWKKVFFLEVVTLLKRRFFLACYGCEFLKFPQFVPVEQLRLVKEPENLLLAQESHDFLLRFTSIELYSETDFNSYDTERFREFSERELFGIRKPILSVDDLHAPRSTS